MICCNWVFMVQLPSRSQDDDDDDSITLSYYVAINFSILLNQRYDWIATSRPCNPIQRTVSQCLVSFSLV